MLNLFDPVDPSPPGSSAHSISQARILEWVCHAFLRGSSQPRDRTCISYISCADRQVLYHQRPLGNLFYYTDSIRLHWILNHCSLKTNHSSSKPVAWLHFFLSTSYNFLSSFFSVFHLLSSNGYFLGCHWSFLLLFLLISDWNFLVENLGIIFQGSASGPHNSAGITQERVKSTLCLHLFIK